MLTTLVRLTLPTLLILSAVFLTGGCAGSGAGSGKRAGVDLDNPDKAAQSPWVEDTPPPPPVYSLDRLIDVSLPPGFAIKMGIDPKTIMINIESGVVRYVVVARGTSAVNAMYEGIRCSSGEFRIYARQVQGQAWVKPQDQSWKSLDGQTGTMLQHPQILADAGLCDGATLSGSAQHMEKMLKGDSFRTDLYRR